MKLKYDILVISSYPPSRSAGLVQDVISALEAESHNVDFFTLFSFPGQKSNQYNVYREPLLDKLMYWKEKFPIMSILRPVRKLFFRFGWQKSLMKDNHMETVENNGWRIPHINEANPPLDVDILLDKLPNKQYDFILMYITERMLTAPSYVAIYDKYKVPILFGCLDMIHFTGGCYFFGDCKRFMEGCGKCPALGSDDENDQTHLNYLLKKDVFSKIQYAITCNGYQKQFALQCGLFDSRRIFNFLILIDEEKFVPNDMNMCRKRFRLPAHKKFIILARYDGAGLYRAKGYENLVNIINIYSRKVSKEMKEDSLLVLIGKKDVQFESRFELDTINLGWQSLDNLIQIYSAANVFISTSIDDAGPSMVNQSMMCARPVVTFSIGTALEVTRNGINGYMIPNYDDEAFSDAIIKIANMSKENYLEMCSNTRKIAIELTSRAAKVKSIISTFEHIKNIV